MEQLILFLLAFSFSFVGRISLYIFSERRVKKKKSKLNHSGLAIEIKYLVKKFGLDKNRIDNKKIVYLISVLDALIIAITFVVITVITDNLLLELFLGIILVTVLIYCLYEIVGRILNQKGNGKNGL